MKYEYPTLFAKTSTIIAIPILLIVISFFITHAINLPASEVFPMAITAFGIIAALSGVCFTMAPSKTDDLMIRYAGEKFLHSSLLLIQSIIMIYAKDSLISLDFMSKYVTIKTLTIIFFGIIITWISTLVGITFFHGFDALNNDLWKKWGNRIEDINKIK